MSLDGKIKNERCVKYTHMFIEIIATDDRAQYALTTYDAHWSLSLCAARARRTARHTPPPQPHRAGRSAAPHEPRHSHAVHARRGNANDTPHIRVTAHTQGTAARERRREAAAARREAARHRRPQHAALQHAAPRTCTAAHRAHHTTAQGRRPSTYRYTRGDPRSQRRRGSRTPIAIVHAHACSHGTRTSHRRHTSHTWPTS